MRLDISKRPQLLVIYPTLLIVVASIFRHIYIDSTLILDNTYGVASQQLHQLFGNSFYLVNKFSILLYLIGGIVLTRLSIAKELFSYKSLYPLIFYIVFSTSFFTDQNNVIEALTSLLVILSLNRLLISFNTKRSNFHYLFTAGVLMGVTPLLIPQAIFIFPLILISCMIFKRSVNELITSIGGYILPILLYSYILWALNYPFSTVFDNISSVCSGWGYRHLTEHVMTGSYALYSTIIFLITIITSVIAAVIYSIKNKELQQTPPMYVLMVLYSLGILTLPTLQLSTNPTSLVSVLAIPLAILISSLFIQNNRSKLFLIIYIVIILLSIYANMNI